MTADEKYMKEALRQAKKAEALLEVPIGCVIVQNDKIIARGYNRRNTDKNTLSHAELNAIRKASKKTGDWRLEDCTMYITLEPCQMCAGAIVQARMGRVVIGAMNPKAGCAGSILNLLEMSEFNHQVNVERGVLEKECSTMLSEFFKKLRKQKKQVDKVKDSSYTEKDRLIGDPKYVIKLPRSRGFSGSLYLQSATAGVMFCPGLYGQYAALCKQHRRLGLAQQESVNRVRSGMEQL